jgi:glycosyltransferase involved in cell wall biosynthesis
MKRKVAIIDTLGAHGGSFHFYTFGQCIGLSNAGVQLSLYANNETENPHIKGVHFYSFYNNLFSSKYKWISGLRWVVGTLKSVLHARLQGISVFHLHIFYTNILILFNLFLVKLLFGKVVLTVHDVTSFDSENESTIISKFIYNLTDIVLTHNAFSKNEIIKVTSISSSNIYIIPHGNYTPFISIQNDKSNSKEKLNLPKDKTILLFFGMIKKVKGLEILLEAFKKVVDTNSDIVLLIAGKPWENDFAEYQKIIDRNNLSKHIILHTKFIPHEDVEHYYCASDLVVLPYKKIYQSGVLMMTLSYERPALVSDLPPLIEVITDNENGFLFASEDEEDLTDKIIKIISDKENLEKVRLKGIETVNTKYGWDEIGRLTKKAYQTL